MLSVRTGGTCIYSARRGAGGDPNPSPEKCSSTVEAPSTPYLQVSLLDGISGISYSPYPALHSPDSLLSSESESMVEGLAPCVDYWLTQNVFTVPSLRDTILITSLPDKVSEICISDLLVNELAELFFDILSHFSPLNVS